MRCAFRTLSQFPSLLTPANSTCRSSLRFSAWARSEDISGPSPTIVSCGVRPRVFSKTKCVEQYVGAFVRNEASYKCRIAIASNVRHDAKHAGAISVWNNCGRRTYVFRYSIAYRDTGRLSRQMVFEVGPASLRVPSAR